MYHRLRTSAKHSIKNVSVNLPNISNEKVSYNLISNDLTTEVVSNVITFDGVSEVKTSKLKNIIDSKSFKRHNEGLKWMLLYKTLPYYYTKL